jgi:hypothetical protein
MRPDNISPSPKSQPRDIAGWLFGLWSILELALLIIALVCLELDTLLHHRGTFHIAYQNPWTDPALAPLQRVGACCLTLLIDAAIYPAIYAVFFVPLLLLLSNRYGPSRLPRPVRLLLLAGLVLLPLVAEILLLRWWHTRG